MTELGPTCWPPRGSSRRDVAGNTGRCGGAKLNDPALLRDSCHPADQVELLAHDIGRALSRRAGYGYNLSRAQSEVAAEAAQDGSGSTARFRSAAATHSGSPTRRCRRKRPLIAEVSSAYAPPRRLVGVGCGQ